MTKNIKSAIGRPSISVSRDTLVDLYTKYQNWDIVAEKLGISRSTLFLKKKELGIERRFVYYA